MIQKQLDVRVCMISDALLAEPLSLPPPTGWYQRVDAMPPEEDRCIKRIQTGLESKVCAGATIQGWGYFRHSMKSIN